MKKIRFAFTITKVFAKNQMQNRINMILNIFSIIFKCSILFLLYACAFKISGGIIGGSDYTTTIWSMFIYFCVMSLNLRKLDKLIMNDMKSGNIEMFMNKPIDYLLISFCKTVGQGLMSFLFVSLIGSTLISFTVGVPDVDLLIFIPTFILALIFGQIISLILYGIVGIMSFFIEDITPIHWIMDKFIMLLGGSYLPISMFPKFMQTLALISPFGAINFASSSVYKYWNSEWIYRISWQFGWIVVLSIFLNILYKKSKEKVMINGG